jgi:hypothetical protein
MEMGRRDSTCISDLEGLYAACTQALDNLQAGTFMLQAPNNTFDRGAEGVRWFQNQYLNDLCPNADYEQFIEALGHQLNRPGGFNSFYACTPFEVCTAAYCAAHSIVTQKYQSGMSFEYAKFMDHCKQAILCADDTRRISDNQYARACSENDVRGVELNDAFVELPR